MYNFCIKKEDNLTDILAPTISSVVAVSTTTQTAFITWITSELSTTQISYGPTSSYGNTTTLVAGLSVSHSQLIMGLTPGTLYHYKVISKDAVGNIGSSNDATFTTPSVDILPTPPATPLVDIIAPSFTSIFVGLVSLTGANISGPPMREVRHRCNMV